MKISATRIKEIKKELGIKSSSKFIDTRYKKNDKKKKLKNINEKSYNLKNFIKYCEKNKHHDILFYHDYYLTNDEDREAFRKNFFYILDMPNCKDVTKCVQYKRMKRKENNKAYKAYIKKKRPKNLNDMLKYEEKYEKNQNKIIKRYRKKGFVYSNNVFKKIDFDDFKDKIIKKHKEIKKINNKLLEEVKSSSNRPDYLDNLEDKLNEVEKNMAKKIKRYRKDLEMEEVYLIDKLYD